ncbi:hypothetical protein DFH28DRAFT_1077281 [Melampsora americana]|nr:hypothetical protein DFH28DRAFT_1077281 [Melampsora americana]
MDHLEFMPRLSTSKSKVNCLVQSKKWREGLDCDLRVQMVSSKNGHFFLYKPAQLYSQNVVIPIFFYNMDNEVLAKCAPAHTICEAGADGCASSDGKIIRHMPLVPYCNDLLGNISKRWNKHIAYYFTLAGLPPKLANQEYNCHFLTTSNTAGALELGNPLVDEINDLSTNGFVAYNHLLDTEVLVMTVVICHLGDSPMHAEITNTMNPSSSLIPCQICNLQAKSMMEKRTTKYICDFVRIDEDEFKNTLNMFFVKRIQDFFRDPKLSNVDVSELCCRLNEEFGERLFNPFLRLKGFNGHLNTPVEMLHVILLGVTNYLLRNQMI